MNIYLIILLTFYIFYFNVLATKTIFRPRAKSLPEIKIQQNNNNNEEEEQILNKCLYKIENIEQIEECLFLLVSLSSFEIPKELLPNLQNDLIVNTQPKNYLTDENKLNLGGILAKELWEKTTFKELLVILNKIKIKLKDFNKNKLLKDSIGIVKKILKINYERILQIIEKIERKLNENKNNDDFKHSVSYLYKVIEYSKNDYKNLEEALNNYKLKNNLKNKIIVKLNFIYAKNGLYRFGILTDFNEEQINIFAKKYNNNEKDEDINKEKTDLYEELTGRKIIINNNNITKDSNDELIALSFSTNNFCGNFDIEIMNIFIKMAKIFKENSQLLLLVNEENNNEKNNKIIENILKNIFIKNNGLFKIENNSLGHKLLKGINNKNKRIVTMKKNTFFKNCIKYITCTHQFRSKSLGQQVVKRN